MKPENQNLVENPSGHGSNPGSWSCDTATCQLGLWTTEMLDWETHWRFINGFITCPTSTSSEISESASLLLRNQVFL